MKRKTALRLLGTLFMATLHITLVAQTIYYVKPVATGTGNGNSWANASSNLQAMINMASAGDQVWVAAGTYTPNAGSGIMSTFQLKSGVAVYGGFAGTETDLSQRNLEENVSILSGDLAGNDESGLEEDFEENSLHVVTANSTGAGTRLDGFTITSGNAVIMMSKLTDAKTYTGWCGGGVFANGGSLELYNCTFFFNYGHIGAAVFGLGTSLDIQHCSFIGNLGFLGGAVNAVNGNLQIDHCLFDNNVSMFVGPSIYVDHENVTISNSEFKDNIGTLGNIMNLSSNMELNSCNIHNNVLMFAGVLWQEEGETTLNDCVISANSGESGSGLITLMGTLSINHSTFNDNIAQEMDGAGGALLMMGTQAQIYGSTFSRNITNGSGGAIAVGRDANVLIVSSQLDENTAFRGGGALYVWRGTAAVANATIVKNTSELNGESAVHVDPDGVIGIVNSILWGNMNSHGITNTASGHFLEVYYSIVQNGYSGTQILTDDPQFVDFANGDYRLKPCSPAINAGQTSLYYYGEILEPYEYDITGEVRIQYDEVDMGAYENSGFTIWGLSGQYKNLSSCQKDDWWYYYDSETQYLVLALDTYIPDLDVWGTQLEETMILTEPFVAESREFRVITRGWTANTSSGSGAKVRFFFDPNEVSEDYNTDFSKVIVYKINGDDPYNPGATGYKEYTYTESQPSSTTHFTTGLMDYYWYYVEFEVESFSSGSIGLLTDAMPVVLASFDAERWENAVRLTWLTAAEENVSHFEVQRSLDGRNWKTLASLNAKGWSDTQTSYGFVDHENLPAGMVYYRLRMVDLDQTFAYSKIRSIDLGGGSEFLVYPNPVRERLVLQGSAGFSRYRLVNALGQTLLARDLDQHGTTHLDLADLAEGVYVLQLIRDDGSQETRRIMKYK